MVKEGYYEKAENGLGLAVIDTMRLPGGTVIVNRLSIPPKMRGKGVARKLLTELCNDADAEGVVVKLEFSPYVGMDHARLRKLYAEFGFEGNEKIELLVRQPKKDA